MYVYSIGLRTISVIVVLFPSNIYNVVYMNTNDL